LGKEVSGPSLVLWKLNEPAAGVFASDFRGNVPDLDAPSGVTRPDVVLGGITGFGRVFEGTRFIEAPDTNLKLKLNREITIQMLVRFDLAAQDGAGVPGTVLSLGFRDSSAEDLQFSIELDVSDLPTNRANVIMRWEDSTGTLETTNTGVDFIWPLDEAGTEKVLLITVVRDWRSSTEVIVRYYANDLFLGKDNSAQGDISGAAGAKVTMGSRGDGAGGNENNLRATVEAVVVFDRVMTAEEVRQIARLISVHDPAGYALMRASVPKNAYSTDPESTIQKELFVDGQAWGRVKGKIAEMNDDFLPDRAWFSLSDWENVLALPPNPGDSFGPRRNRILSFFRAAKGHQIQPIKDALAAPFDIQPSQVEVLEFTELLEDDFTAKIADFWQQVPDGHAITNPAGTLKIAASSGVNHTWALSGSDHAPYVKANIDRDEIESEADPSKDAEVSVLIDTDVLGTDDETIAGVAFYDQVANDLLIWGIFKTGGTVKLGHVEILGGVQSAIVDDGAAPARPFHLNMKFNGLTAGATYELGTATAAARNVITSVVSGTAGPNDPTFVLLGVFGLVSGGPTGTDSLEFDNFRLFTPRGLRVFSWFGFRDPTLPGSPDMPGARKLVTRIKPAHSQGSAVQTKALLCDDPDSLCDDGPLG